MRISESNYYLTYSEAGNDHNHNYKSLIQQCYTGRGGICSIQGGRTNKSEPS
jgi:hypothetical protein